MTEEKAMSFVTDTATLCVFDVSRLKHRINDDADWWCSPDTEILEVNEGNVSFFGLGSDGKYDLVLTSDIGACTSEANIQCPSGRVFIGAGEEVTSDGWEPEGLRGGGFIELSPGNYRVSVSKEGCAIHISFSPTTTGTNNIVSPLRI